MENKESYLHLILKNNEDLDSNKKEFLTLGNGKNPIIKENNYNNSKYITKNKIVKNKYPIPNKRYFKKVNSISDNSIQKNLISFQNLNHSLLKRQNSGIVKRTENYQFYISRSGKVSPNKTINFNKEGKKLNNPIIDISLRLNSKSPKNIQTNLTNKNIFIRDTNNNCSNSEMRTIKNTPTYINSTDFQKDEQKQNLIFKNINNIITNNNYNENYNYSTVNYNSYRNINNNEILFNNPQKTYYKLNNINNYKQDFFPKSPTVYNCHKLQRNMISPLKGREIYMNNNSKNEYEIIKRNKIIKIPCNSINLKKKFPNNYRYHEIIVLNSPKRTVKTYNIKEKQKYIHKNNYSMNECIEKNKNYNNISNNKLIHNLSFTNFNKPIYEDKFQYYSSSTSFQKHNKRNNIGKKYYNNNLNFNENYNSNSINDIPILSYQKNKKYNNDNYMDYIDDNEEIQSSIHYFGEQMLKRNKNYNFPKNENNYNNYLIKGENEKDKSKTKLKICLRKDVSYNKMKNINNKEINYIKPLQKSPLNKENNINNNKKIEKNENNELNNNKDLKKNNKRYMHNIINRKKIKKLVMEKRNNEAFISNSNKKENKNNFSLKDRISYCESSIIDNDSLNDIIKEFEKEIEEDEKKESDKKLNNNKNKKIDASNDSDNFIFSFSDNDFSNVMKNSNNNMSKLKKKIHYYKPKNVDMEKNYDFIIYPTKKDK